MLVPVRVGGYYRYDQADRPSSTTPRPSGRDHRPQFWPRTSTTRQARRRDRLRRDGGEDRARDDRQGRARDDVQRSPTYIPSLPSRTSSAQRVAQAGCREPAPLRGHALEERRVLHARLPALAALAEADHTAIDPQGTFRPGARPLSVDTSLHPEYDPATSACAWSRRRPLPARSAADRRRSSRTASSASRRTASSWRRATTSTPT